jgi:hypothetical protein
MRSGKQSEARTGLPLTVTVAGRVDAATYR